MARQRPVRGDTGLGRLRRRADFVAAAKGRRFHARLLSLQAVGSAETRELDGTTALQAPALRVGITVTKRVGHATERNRIRRRLRSALREAGAPLRDRAADIVIVARRECLSVPFVRLVADLAGGIDEVVRKLEQDVRRHAEGGRPGLEASPARRRRRGGAGRPTVARGAEPQGS